MLEPTTQDVLPGTTLGRGKYLVRDKLGEGGAGMVYEAVDTRIKRRYALKVLYGDLAVFPDMVRRFRREAEAAGRLSHPNVAGVVDFALDIEDEPAFLVMELAEGESLADVVIQKGPLNEARARVVLTGITQGLAHAHEQGVLHRDLKPDNIILDTGTDRPRIVDFGVARVESTASQAKLTHHGVVVGTPGFLAPEVLRGLTPDYRSDLYGLGVTALYMLTGRVPFGEGEDAAITCTLAGLDLSMLEAAPVSDDLRQRVRSLLASEPDERPASALDFADQLAGRASPQPDISSGSSAFASTRDNIPVPAQASPAPEPYEVAPTTAVPLRPAPVSAARARGGWAVGLLVLVSLGAGAWWISRPEPALQTAPAPKVAPPKPAAVTLVAPVAPRAPTKVTRARPAVVVPAPRPSAKSARTPAKPSPKRAVTAQELSAAYAQLGRNLDALESERGVGVAAPLRERYFDLPLADALRRPELAQAVMTKVRSLKRDVRRAQASRTKSRP